MSHMTHASYLVGLEMTMTPHYFHRIMGPIVGGLCAELKHTPIVIYRWLCLVFNIHLKIKTIDIQFYVSHVLEHDFNYTKYYFLYVNEMKGTSLNF